MNLRDLELRVRALLAPRRVERELEDELAFHLERDIQQHVANGLSPDEARRRARARFGPVPLAADTCRDERGTAWFDHVVRDVLYAVRTFRRTPLTALTIVTMVALGLGLVAVVFTFLNVFLFRVDNVRNPQELYAVERPRTAEDTPVRLTRPQYDALVRETGVFSGAFAMLPGLDTPVHGRTMTGVLVTGNFFHVLGVGAARGRALTSSDDERGAGHRVVVLSHRGWMRHFANEPDVLGRTLLLNGVPFQIVGVMPDGFRGLSVGSPDYWAPLAILGQIRRADAGREDAVAIDVVGRLAPGVSRERALAELLVWDARHAPDRTAQRPAATLVLEPRRGTVPRPVELMLLFTPLFLAFGLILLIACANVANLLLARGVARQREIGIRLAMGASRRRIIGQLLTESVLLALVSAALAFAVSRIALEGTIYAITSTLPPDLGDVRLAVPAADWRVAVFLVAGALVSTMFFALAPALQATRIELVRAIRGEVVRDARPGRTRGVLVALQVTASALLLICSAVLLRGALTAATFDPGIRTADTMTFNVATESLRQSILDAVRREPSVAAIAATWPHALGQRAAFAEGARGKATLTYKLVSPEYFSVFGIDLLRGRGFTPTEQSAASAVAVISERTARELWPDRDAIGQVLHLDPDPNAEGRRDDDPPLLARAFLVVGVARDVPGFRLAPLEPLVVYVPTSAESAGMALVVRAHGDPTLARRALLDRLTAIDPSMGRIVTFRTRAGLETYFLQIGFWLTVTLGTLALLLTLSGLFSVLSYLVEQRAREIGVRIALGATDSTIGLLVLSQLARPVVFGLIVGSGLAATLGVVLLATPLAEHIGPSVRPLDPLAYSASLLCIALACASAALIPARRAGRIDPVATLRRD